MQKRKISLISSQNLLKNALFSVQEADICHPYRPNPTDLVHFESVDVFPTSPQVFRREFGQFGTAIGAAVFEVDASG